MPKPSRIWEHFTKLGHVPGLRQKRALCNYCNHELYDAVKRCENHLETCKEADFDILRSYFGPSFRRRNRGQWSTRRNSTIQTVENPIIENSTALPDSSAFSMITDTCSFVSSTKTNMLGEKITMDLMFGLARDLFKIYDSMTGHDLVIHVGQAQNSQCLNAHSPILSARSPYFAAAIANNQIVFHEPSVTPRDFKILMR